MAHHQSVSVSEPKLAIFSGPYLRMYLFCNIEIWYSLQDYIITLYNLYLKWILSFRGVKFILEFSHGHPCFNSAIRLAGLSLVSNFNTNLSY